MNTKPDHNHDYATTDSRSFSLQELMTVAQGEEARSLLGNASLIKLKYGPLHAELADLLQLLRTKVEPILTLLSAATGQFNPDNVFGSIASELNDTSFMKFTLTVGGTICQFISRSHSRLSSLRRHLNLLLPVLDDKINLASSALSLESGNVIMQTLRDEYRETIPGFDGLLAKTYAATKVEYRKLRRHYLGEASKRNNRPDDLEDHIMEMMFGGKRPEPAAPVGPARSLVDDNCVLTRFLDDVAESLPEPYERNQPVFRNGVATGKVKTIKSLDDGEVNDFAHSLLRLSDSQYQHFLRRPETLTYAIIGTLLKFYAAYQPIEPAMRALLDKCDLGLSSEDLAKPLANPVQISRQYTSINFMAIRPAQEDIAPRTRAEQDLAKARTKLLEHLNATFQQLEVMDRDQDAFAVTRTKEAIELRQAMLDVAKSEHQKSLAANIRLESWICDTEPPADIGTEIVLEELVAELKDIVSMVASSLGGTGWDRGTPTSDPL